MPGSWLWCASDRRAGGAVELRLDLRSGSLTEFRQLVVHRSAIRMKDRRVRIAVQLVKCRGCWCAFVRTPVLLIDALVRIRRDECSRSCIVGRKVRRCGLELGKSAVVARDLSLWFAVAVIESVHCHQTDRSPDLRVVARGASHESGDRQARRESGNPLLRHARHRICASGPGSCPWLSMSVAVLSGSGSTAPASRWAWTMLVISVGRRDSWRISRCDDVENPHVSH